MSVVAVDSKELAKIIDWAKKQGREPPLSICARSPQESASVCIRRKIGVYTEHDNIPKTGAYTAHWRSYTL